MANKTLSGLCEPLIETRYHALAVPERMRPMRLRTR